jgi:hypothetical protein
MSIKDFINKLEKATIEYRIRKDFGKSYSVDTCMLLHALGPPNEKSRIKNIPEWCEKANLTIYNFILRETLSKINEICSRYESREIFNGKRVPNYLEGVESRLIKKINRPNVRIVDDIEILDNNSLKKLNSSLFENLLSEKGLSDVDRMFLIVSDYEKNKIVSVDNEVCKVCFKYNLKFVDTRIIKKLPY